MKVDKLHVLGVHLREWRQLIYEYPFVVQLYIFAVLQLSADAKVVLRLCTPTYMQQDYPLIIITNIYKCDMNSEVL